MSELCADGISISASLNDVVFGLRGLELEEVDTFLLISASMPRSLPSSKELRIGPGQGLKDAGD